jgi:GNAT superfamily N-acetyltransferase
MKIHSAEYHDKATVLDFCKNTFSWGDYVADVWDSWQSKGGLYVVEDDGKVVGVYNLTLFEKQAWIEGMRVHPEHRRKGLGKNMFEHAESIIQNKTIRLIIESENHPSIRLVESMGYCLEDKWRLYSMIPTKKHYGAKIVKDVLQLKDLIDSKTYADSWKWLPLDSEELQKLIDQERVVISNDNGKSLAIGIWNRSRDFPQVFQIGYLSGTNDGIMDILRCIGNKAYELNCERLQIFVHEKTSLDVDFLDKRSLFYLMRKEMLRKNL